jgi:hypothetical protein
MKNKKRIFCFFVIVSLAFATCELVGWNDPIIVPGADLAAKLSWLEKNGSDESRHEYIIAVDADESISPVTLSRSATLVGAGAPRVISLSSNGSLFTVNDGVTLVLENNITLRGRSNNIAPLVQVSRGGTLVMNEGSFIIGNTANGNGGGVLVFGGTFTMNGGTITGNTASGSGGGVYVNGETFSSNYAQYVNAGTFTMNGGTITGNTTSGDGGGVYVDRGDWQTPGTFVKNGGTITGYASDMVNGNVVKNSSGTVRNNNGHAVCVRLDYNTYFRRETTAGPTVNLDTTKSGTAGGWEN